MPIFFHKNKPLGLIPNVKAFWIVSINFTKRGLIKFKILSERGFGRDFMCIFEMVYHLFLLHGGLFLEIRHVGPFQVKEG